MSSAPAAPWNADERLAVAVLAGLPGMTVARLRSLLHAARPGDALGIAAGQLRVGGAIDRVLEREPALASRWSAVVAAGTDRVADELDACGVRVVGPDDPEWPPAFRVDPAPPSALFVVGWLPGERRRAAIVGTRRPTAAGRQLAARFGHELAAAGVSVVSGLALGIDGAAHQGALSVVDGAPPLAVVANGHDRPYPRRHAELWHAVARRGAVVSEWPPGTPPDAFRFPLRNRLIAALSEVVVVVESREAGGSLITARDAAERGVDVFAVPGSPGSRASRGTNRLVQDGAGLVLDPDEVLTALELDHRRSGVVPVDPRPTPSRDAGALMRVLADGPATIDTLASRTGASVGEVAMQLARLERSGWVFETDGWFESLDEWSMLLDARRRGGPADHVVPDESGYGDAGDDGVAPS